MAPERASNMHSKHTNSKHTPASTLFDRLCRRSPKNGKRRQAQPPISSANSSTMGAKYFLKQPQALRAPEQRPKPKDPQPKTATEAMVPKDSDIPPGYDADVENNVWVSDGEETEIWEDCQKAAWNSLQPQFIPLQSTSDSMTSGLEQCREDEHKMALRSCRQRWTDGSMSSEADDEAEMPDLIDVTLYYGHEPSGAGNGAGIGGRSDTPIAEIGLFDTEDSRAPLSHTSSITTNASKTISNPPFGWPGPKYDPSQPFPFFRLPENVRHQIIGCLDSPINKYRENGAISPSFNCGSVYLHAEQACRCANIDLSILYAGNRAWYTDTAKILYQNNYFAISNPVVGDWWLHRIGRNLDWVTRLALEITAGNIDGPNGRTTRREFLWLKMLHWLKDRHQLQMLSLSFVEWRFLARDVDRWWHDCARWREEILLTLLGFRGLACFRIQPGFWHRQDDDWPSVSECVWDDLGMTAQLPRGANSEAEERMRGFIRREWDRQGLKGLKYSFG